MTTESDNFITGTFCPTESSFLSKIEAPKWAMSLKAAGNMRFRWNETNLVRDNFLSSIASCKEGNVTEKKEIACVELIHSRKVFAVDSSSELYQCKGDGIISQNKNLIPVITVADCMPIFLYEPKKQVFGVLHSGWKGTGIVQDAILLAEKKYGTNRKDFYVVMGPHIQSCCYKVDSERANYFKQNFTEESVLEVKDDSFTQKSYFALSLAKANLALLLKLEVPRENIFIHSSCTCCDSKFGSFRRQTSNLPCDMPLEERMKHFTVQAAWVKW